MRQEEFAARFDELVRELDPECQGVLVLASGQRISINGVKIGEDGTHVATWARVQDILCKGIHVLYTVLEGGGVAEQNVGQPKP